MINAYNVSQQTVAVGDGLVFDGLNFGRNRCFCNTTNNNFMVTRNGTYSIRVNTNVTPTVAGQITLNLVASGTDLTGGEIQLPGAVVGTYDNGSAEVIVNLFAGTRISLVNNSANPVTFSAAGTSIVINRIA